MIKLDKIKKFSILDDELKKYFNKKILNTLFVILAIFTFIVIFSNNGNYAPAYVECIKPFYRYCENPYYGATGKLCELNEGLCTIPLLEEGESIGDKPNFITLQYNNICFIITIIFLLINHIVWRIKWKK